MTFQIGNRQLEIENRQDGRPAPAHMKLGAKWVEVRNGGLRLKVIEDGSDFENVASNTR